MHINTLPRYSRARFAREGGDGGGGGGQGAENGQQQGAGGQNGGQGFQPITSQEDFDRAIQDRIRRATSKFADYDTLKEKAARADELALELGTDLDKAAAKARTEAAAERDGHWTPRVIRAEFRAELKGRVPDDQLNARLDALLEDVDLSKFTKDGDVDHDKIVKKVEAWVPANSNNGGGGQHQRHIDLGQGGRQQADAKKGDQGRAMAQKRFGDRVNSARAGSST